MINADAYYTTMSKLAFAKSRELHGRWMHSWYAWRGATTATAQEAAWAVLQALRAEIVA